MAAKSLGIAQVVVHLTQKLNNNRSVENSTHDS